MEKIIVTGATSMIGIALIKEAILNRLEIYAIVRPGSSRISRLPDSEYIHLIEWEISELSGLQNLPDADVFYHFAWIGTEKTKRDNPMIQERNIRYSIDAVELAARCHCSKFIGAGSQAEYGIVLESVTEATEPKPISSYGMAKFSAYMLCRKVCEQKNMDFVWGRIFSVYGVNDNEGTMLTYAIDKFISGDEASFSESNQMWNYLYETDAGKIFCQFGKDGTKGVYNVANWKSYPLINYIMELAEVSRDKFCLNVKYSIGENTDKNVVSIHPDMTKLKNAIGVMHMRSFREGIERVISSRIFDKRGEGIQGLDLSV